MERKIKCPNCGRETIYSNENKYRPFCSERCRLIDLGAWADENYRVPSNTPVDFAHSDELEELKKIEEND